MVSEGSKEGNQTPERTERIQLDISNRILAEVERATRLTGRRNRSMTIEEWLRWAVESVDPQTGKLPDRHPATERSLSEISSHPVTTFKGTLQRNLTK